MHKKFNIFINGIKYNNIASILIEPDKITIDALNNNIYSKNTFSTDRVKSIRVEEIKDYNSAEDKYNAFINDINALAKKYGYKCTFDDTFVFDSGFDMTIHVDDTTFEI